MSSINEQALDAIRQRPGIGSGALASALGIPPCNARRAGKALAAMELVTIADNDNGYAYYPIGSASRVMAAQPETSLAASRPSRVKTGYDGSDADFLAKSTENSPQVIEAQFRGIPAPASSSRALVPSPGAAATFDSRLAGTLERNERAHGSPWAFDGFPRRIWQRRPYWLEAGQVRLGVVMVAVHGEA
jgi:hypothetical protein